MFTSSFKIGSEKVAMPDAALFYEIIQKIGIAKSIPKGRTVIRRGTYASHFLFIEDGILQTSTTINNRKYTLGFSFAGDIDCCPSALLTGRENNFTIEAITDSEILLCALADFKKACTEVEYYKIVNSALVYYLSVIEKRLIDSISLTAEERYKLMLQFQPEKIGQIPLSQIASFLGISQERLSRIRQHLA